MLVKKIKRLLIKMALIFTLTASILIPNLTTHKTYANTYNNKYTIVVDVSHRDTIYDRGASAYGVYESDISLSVSQIVKNKLEAKGYRVVFTRQNDNDIKSLKDRVNIANSINPELYLSIHANSSERVATGTETIIDTVGGRAEKVAKEIQKEICSNLNMEDRGVIHRNLYTRNIKASTVLVELGFINNKEDLSKMLEQQDTYADCLVNAIDNVIHN